MDRRRRSSDASEDEPNCKKVQKSQNVRQLEFLQECLDDNTVNIAFENRIRMHIGLLAESINMAIQEHGLELPNSRTRSNSTPQTPIYQGNVDFFDTAISAAIKRKGLMSNQNTLSGS